MEILNINDISNPMMNIIIFVNLGYLLSIEYLRMDLVGLISSHFWYSPPHTHWIVVPIFFLPKIYDSGVMIVYFYLTTCCANLIHANNIPIQNIYFFT